MSQLTTYDLADGIATITMDDGKANALSPAMLGELSAAFDRAETDGAIVLLTGRERTFCGGFDLRTEPAGWPAMVAGGARLAERILSFPHPTIAACNGNAVAMGSTVPRFGIALAQHRLTRPYADRCLLTGALLEPEEACAAGFLDRVVAPEQLAADARAGIDRTAHVKTKLHARELVLAGVRDGIERIEAGGTEGW